MFAAAVRFFQIVDVDGEEPVALDLCRLQKRREEKNSQSKRQVRSGHHQQQDRVQGLPDCSARISMPVIGVTCTPARAGCFAFQGLLSPTAAPAPASAPSTPQRRRPGGVPGLTAAAAAGGLDCAEPMLTASPPPASLGAAAATPLSPSAAAAAGGCDAAPSAPQPALAVAAADGSVASAVQVSAGSHALLTALEAALVADASPLVAPIAGASDNLNKFL